jgi:hypothetical protein
MTASLDVKEHVDRNYATDLFSTKNAKQDNAYISGSLKKIKSDENCV